jgi:hypothetical protein
MKIKFPTAKSLRKSIVVPPKRNMSSVVKRFLEGDVLDGVLDAQLHNRDGVNVKVPSEAYNDLNEFYKLCDGVLKPLGYYPARSDDGAGQYNTLFISW